MQNIQLVCLGRLKEDYLRAAFAEYEKRLLPLVKLTVIELAAERLPDDPSKAQIDAALKKEAAAILSLPSLGYLCALCLEGKEMTSEDFSRTLSSLGASGKNRITFVIGSSYGLDSTVKARADLLLSFSKMTFPHQLMRVLFAEQLYRACQIGKGSKYHK